MDITLHAKKRDSSVKAKTLRKEGWVPACVYGKGQESINIQIPYSELKSCLKGHAHKMTLQVEGAGKFMVGVEEIQKGHQTDQFDHVSFHALKSDEKATLTIEVMIEGKAIGTTEGGVVNQLVHEIDVKGYPNDLPDSITVNVAELGVGDIIHLSDIAGNFPFEFVGDLEKVVAKCAHPKVVVLETVEVEATEEFAEVTTEEESTEEVATEEKKAA